MEAAASVVGLLSVGAQTYRILNEFVSTCKDAPATAKAIRDGAGEFQYALQKLAPYIRQTAEITPLGKSSTDLAQLKVTLVSCVDTFCETQKLLDRLAPAKQEKMDYLGRMRWSLAEGSLNKLQNRIEKHKTSLILLLTIWTSESSAQTETNVDNLNDLLTNLMVPGREMEPPALPFSPHSSDSDPGQEDVSDDTCSVSSFSTRKSFGEMSKYTSILRNSRPYRNPAVLEYSGFSVRSSQRRTHWSVFTGGSNTSVFALDYTLLEDSGRTLAEEPNLCQVLLPLQTHLLYDPSWYPPSASALEPNNSLSSGRLSSLPLFGGTRAQILGRKIGQNQPSIRSNVGQGLSSMTAELYSSSSSYEDFAVSYFRHLQDACSKGDLLRIQILLGWKMAILRLYPERRAKGLGVHCRWNTATGDTVLNMAARATDQLMMEMLLDQGADINRFDSHGVTALQIAISTNNHGIARMLLDRGADANKYTNACTGFKMPLYMAAEADDQVLVDMLLNHGADPNLSTDKGDTALHVSLQANNGVIRDMLLDHGADVNQRGKDGQTALHIAIEAQDQALITMLLDRGAEMNKYDEYHDILVHLAIRAKDQARVKMLLDQGANADSSLVPVVGARDQLMVKMLLDGGADPNNLSIGGYAALHIAAINRNDILLDMLLSRGANVDMLSSNGEPALHIAAKKADHVVIDMLLKRGSNINVLNEDGKAALHIAAKDRDHVMVKALLDRGANINEPNKYHKTALDLANQASEDAQNDHCLQRSERIQSAEELIGILSSRGAKSGSDLEWSKTREVHGINAKADLEDLEKWFGDGNEILPHVMFS